MSFVRQRGVGFVRMLNQSLPRLFITEATVKTSFLLVHSKVRTNPGKPNGAMAIVDIHKEKDDPTLQIA